MYQSESELNWLQSHFLRSLLDGKREITEEEAEARKEKLLLTNLKLPCVVICASPYYEGVKYSKKDELIQKSSDYFCQKMQDLNHVCYCLTNSYDNIQIILSINDNHILERELDNMFIRLREKYLCYFGQDLFIGIGSIVKKYAQISRSALEAMEMLAYKNQYADRGVISIKNTIKFKHYSIYGEDIMFARVIGQFQDGNLVLMSERLDEMVESIRQRPGISKTAIKRTLVELTVNLLHIASNADVDVEEVLDIKDPYSWIMAQNHTEVIKEWLMNLSSRLLEKMEKNQKREEKTIIKQACEFISNNIGNQDLSLQSVSEEVGLSATYFSQLFKEEKSIGLNSYITESRIKKAQELLRDTNLRSEDIALQLGFTTSTYFGRVFKKQVGITPGEYRKHILL